MVESGVLSVSGASVTLNPDADSDRFYIRISGGASFGADSVKLATVDNSDASYNDDATEIDLQVEGNDLITKSMLLVSDDVDDDHPVDGIADDAKNDRTHKIQLGGNLQIMALKLGGTEHQVDVKTPVPIVKTVHINAVILNASTGGEPVIAEAAVEADLRIARERYAQAGLHLTWTIEIKDPPAGVNLSDGLSDYFLSDDQTSEETALFQDLGTPATDDIHAFYVNYIDSGVNRLRAGHTFTAGNFVISAEAKTPFTIGHELGHVLGISGHPDTRDIILMRPGGTSESNTLGGSKRIPVEQEIIMQGSSYAK
jgi:hypothetical protein